MNETRQQDRLAPYTFMNGKQLLQVALLGACIGLLVWGLGFLLDTYIVRAVLCQGKQIGCTAGAGYGEAIASIIAACFGLFMLVRLHIFRPLLIVLAATISLWGIVSTASLLPWYGVGLSCALLYAFAYMVFTWITRLRLFWMVITLLLMVIVCIRLILKS